MLGSGSRRCLSCPPHKPIPPRNPEPGPRGGNSGLLEPLGGFLALGGEIALDDGRGRLRGDAQVAPGIDVEDVFGGLDSTIHRGGPCFGVANLLW
jgi:hypothetical protein